MLRRLEKLQRQISKEHEKAQRDSQQSGINLARKATLEAIEASEFIWHETNYNARTTDEMLEKHLPALAKAEHLRNSWWRGAR